MRLKPNRKPSLSHRIFRYFAILVVSSLILLGIIWMQSTLEEYNNQVAFLKENYIANKTTEIKNKVLQIKDYICWVQNNPIDSLSKAMTIHPTDVSPAQLDHFLQEYILDSLSRLRYSKDEYVFVNTYEGKALISNGGYNKIPIDILKSGDTAWISVFNVQCTSKDTPGGVFHTYRWSKISTNGYSIKTSFFSYLPNWKWIIGTGFYEDDVNSIIAARKKVLYDNIRNNIIKIALLLLALTLISYIIVVFITRRFQRNIQLFTNFFEKTALNNVLIDKSQVTYQEFENMAVMANLMIEQRKKAMEERQKSEEEVQRLNQTLEERVKRRTAQLVAINEELESFSYSISHDLRAPLRAIMGFSQILVQDHEESLNKDGKQFLSYIVHAGLRMERLINDLLSYARMGRKSFKFHEVNLDEIISSIQADFKQRLEEIGGSITTDLDKVKVIGEETLFLQILTNLIDNSIIYRQKEVPLKIRIEIHQVDKTCILSVADNGIGIPKEQWGKIFNIFQRLHSEDKYPGTGIGLSTVKKAASLMNGTVWVDSALDKGTTFFIRIPNTKNPNPD